MDVLFNDFNVVSFSIMCFPTSCKKKTVLRRLANANIAFCMELPQLQENSSS